MGSPQNCYCTHRIIFFLFLLFVSSSILMQFVAQGGPDWEKKTMVIGSTPPRCERRCKSCGPCESVQVPVLSQKRSSIAYSRGDDISNYKPMSWKCKCGNLIFNP